MSVSFNTKQLEVVSQFSTFLDLVKNPERFEDYLKEAKNTLAEMRILVEARSKLDSLDVFIKEETTKLEQASKSLDKERAEFEDLKIRKHREHEAKVGNLIDHQERLEKFSKELSLREDLLKTNEVRLKEERKELQVSSLDVKVREDSVASREREVSEKATKLKELLG